MLLEGKKIAFLGASIERGAYLSNQCDCYTERIKSAIPWNGFYNYSVPGSRIGEYIGPDPKRIKGSFLERYPQMPDGMDIVVVSGGSNDFGIGNAPMGAYSDKDPYTFCGAVNLLFDGLKKKYPDAAVVVILPLHRRDENHPNMYSGAVLEDYVQVLHKKASEYGFLTCDLRSAPGLQGDDAYYSDFMEDGLHPFEKTHALLAKELLTYLMEV